MGHDDELFTIKLYHTYRQANLGTSIEGNNDNTSGVGTEAFFFLLIFFRTRERLPTGRRHIYSLLSFSLSSAACIRESNVAFTRTHSLTLQPSLLSSCQLTPRLRARTHGWPRLSHIITSYRAGACAPVPVRAGFFLFFFFPSSSLSPDSGGFRETRKIKNNSSAYR